MFKKPFSFEGRIRRTEYGLSIIIIIGIIYSIPTNYAFIIWRSPVIFWLSLIPFNWFLLAQGAKRCHDRNHSGWYQLIPFYGLWILFGVGDFENNDYGPDPKNPSVNTETEIDAYAYKNYIESAGAKVSLSTNDDLLTNLHQLHTYIREEKRSVFGSNKRMAILKLISQFCKNKEDGLLLLDSYQNLFNTNLIGDLRKLSSSYDAIKKNVQSFIDLEIVTPEYPHNRL
jgi:uncharacterized membrane protein YhaH (DUF805 family)